MKPAPVVIAACACALASLAFAAPTRYVATRVPAQLYTSADAINAAGDVAGNITIPVNIYGDEEDVSAFVFTADNRFVPIVPDAALAPPGSTWRASGINAAGDVVGWIRTPGNGFQVPGTTRGFRYAAGEVRPLFPYVADHLAIAIDDAGDVAGNEGNHAFVLDTAGRKVVLPQESYAQGLNLFGELAGYFVAARAGNRAVFHPFRYARGVLEDLGTLDDYAYALGINASGDVVGEAFRGDGNPRPFLHAGGTMRHLGDTPGRAVGINGVGTVVGHRFTGTEFHTFVYVDGVLHDLDPLVDGLDGARLVAASAINDAGQIAARACTGARLPDCFGVRLDPLPLPPVRAVEFHHAVMDRYFLTADAGEIAKLDGGALPGWVRTGESFFVHPGPRAGTAPVCRLYTEAFAPAVSHFYTAGAAECATVRRTTAWLFEGVAFYARLPDAAGTCADGTVAVYRLYNDGRDAAPAHRYTTSPAVRATMSAQGWIPEGSGPAGVVMCVPEAPHAIAAP